MHTRCPHCTKLFRVGAAQLKAAHGRVRCGFCFEPFNALEYLQDESEASAAESTPTQPTGVATIERLKTEPIPSIDVPEPIRPQASQANSLPGPRLTERHAPPEEPTKRVDPSASGNHKTLAEDKIPYALRADFSNRAHTHASARGVAWGAASFLLVILFLGHWAWVNRDSLLQRFPALRPWAETACAALGCELWSQRAPSAIKVLYRDVRIHPKYEKTLLVNATLVNEAKFNQPFPVVQLAIFDTAGRTIAMGKFKPQEYLDTSIDLAAGMEPGTPVHIVLEVAGTTEGAVGFEFKFL
ncbi:MAG: zinc-ribbon and DUF3426 domain-containing protein [Gammaproteobacteria bacterium]|nr:zinc-ribbon and DUF3426 domain-containing protein [Gammaproteobacteria bacterium]MCI0591436.1 zinc-ribbon and DUF3426 domain-containing protein [Gammaproteobacteria bacterium]